MEHRQNKKAKLTCMRLGPGPIYKLPSLTGYIGHDPSKNRNPAFSVRNRVGKTIFDDTPGPIYTTYQLTNRGKEFSPAFVIGRRLKSRNTDTGPGAANYRTENIPPINHQKRAPAFSMLFRRQEKLRSSGPGPNQYSTPTCIGPHIPDKKALGAFSMAFVNPTKKSDQSPGPAAYEKVKIDLVKKSTPAYSMRWRNTFSTNNYVPGPRFDGNYNFKKKSPAYSFGLKHSECAIVPSTAEDQF